MPNFWTNFNLGLSHLLNIHEYIHIFFLLALTVTYETKHWGKITSLIALITVGHLLTSLLTIFNIVTIKSLYVDFLILILVLIIAFFNISTIGKSGKKEPFIFIAIITSIFGIVHGLGYSNYFNSLFQTKPSDKLLPLIEFSFGILISQTIVIILGLLLAFVVQNLFKFTKRDWVLIVSSFIVGVVIPLIINSKILTK